MSRVEQIRHSLRTARRMTLGLLDGVPPQRWTWQSFPGQNHVAWTLMHLVIADDWGPTSLGDPSKRFVDRFGDLVGGGPDQAPDVWPSADDILRMMDEAHERFLACFDGITDTDLDRKTAGAIAEYAPDLGCLLDSHVWHEGFHGGQISVIRKGLGLPPRFG